MPCDTGFITFCHKQTIGVNLAAGSSQTFAIPRPGLLEQVQVQLCEQGHRPKMRLFFCINGLEANLLDCLQLLRLESTAP